ncbi:MsnO8 family LLM class oxidoreductase [Kitasatospora sp. NPDC096077]|uniref:MsnO8 family LLM class oxidoreductase n=1 Tax=Kitasatospora sp. NPDC096077 TaxID=3155544 RepID=UPI00331CD71D
MMQLTAFDQVLVYGGTGPAGAARESVRLAVAAERLGYHRFWVAEHHGATSGCGSPEVLVAAAAAATAGIRVGTASVLLPHYAPLKVATTFNLLERLHPGRIDLGIGRGPGAGESVTRLLAREGEAPYHEKIEQLLAHLTAGTDLLPDSTPPQLWLTGAGAGGAHLAAHFGLPFCFAQFAHGVPRPEIVELYREKFRPGPLGAVPRVAVAVRVACADDPGDVRLLRAGLALGAAAVGRRTLPSWDELHALAPTVALPDAADPADVSVLAGVPAEVAERLAALTAAYTPDELAVTTLCPDLDLRIRTFELLRAMVPGPVAPVGR